MSSLTQEDIEFIKNLSHEMKTQDNRSTASPYSYRVQQSVKLFSTDYYQYDNKGMNIDDEHFDNIEDAFRYIEEMIEDNGDTEQFDNIYDTDDAEVYLDDKRIDYSYYSWEYEDRLCASSQGGTNFFFTEKACEAYIESNHYNLSNPKSYVVHEYRNPEMEKLYEVIHKLAEVL